MQPSPPAKTSSSSAVATAMPLVLRRMGMQPWPPDVRLTLVTNLADTPYSGMLPCHISGLYDFDTAHIDLRPLTRFANCRLIMDEMVGLDPQTQQVFCRHHPPLAYDVLSIDIGSTPTKSQVPGAAQYATPAKPVPQLLRVWEAYLESLEASLTGDPHAWDKITPTIAIVGGGVGGVEMACAMQVRLWQLLARYAGVPHHLPAQLQEKFKHRVAVHILQRGPYLAKGRNRLTQRMIAQMCRDRNIQVHTNESVVEVTEQAVRCESGLEVKCDRTFWVTHASATPWLAQSGLSLTDDGFIAVTDTLQTRSHPNIFAAGDVATMVNHPRPKAGVFAVRQGPPLYENLKRYVVGYPLKAFKPQRRYLNIIDTGTDKAIASWGPFAVHARWCRQWKHKIDSTFMGLFSEFPEMESSPPVSTLTAQPDDRTRRSNQANPANQARQSSPQPLPQTLMPCAGCGSKVGSNTLTRALTRVQAQADNLDGIADDAALEPVPAGKLAVHTVDQFRAIVDDPFIFGQIAVNHCLSDLFAMGATSSHALALATIPYGSEAKQEALYQLLTGAAKALAADQTRLVGGHTTEGPELVLGFACNGWISPEQVWRKSGLKPGQSLILTQALGTGCLFAADMQLQAKGRWIESAIAAMLHSNRLAADCLRSHQATACTDVTGFGLAGHLLEMAQASQVQVSLELEAIALLSGVAHTLEKGIVSSLHERNQNSAIAAFSTARSLPTHHPHFQALFDPQTAGGLLAGIPTDQVNPCLSELHRLGYRQSRCIGQVTEAVSSGDSNAMLNLLFLSS